MPLYRRLAWYRAKPERGFQPTGKRKERWSTTFTSDRDYLQCSIREPKEEIVLGFQIFMPTINLSDEEMYAIIDILQKL